MVISARCSSLYQPVFNGSVYQVLKVKVLSLLNADLKIYAKVLAQCIQNHVPTFVSCNQTGFIKSRLAVDNVR